MKLYEVIDGPARFGPGQIIGLSKGQANPRAHRLEAIDADKGVYRSTAAIEFKTGERIRLGEEPPKKAFAERLAEPGREAEKKKAALADAKAARRRAAS